MRKVARYTLILCLLLGVFLNPGRALAQPPLKAAWEPWFPYAYLTVPTLQSTLTGLDVELLKLFADEAKQHLAFQQTSWEQTLRDLQSGKLDLTTGATYSPERAQYAYFSKPYRTEKNALFVLRSQKKAYHFSTVAELTDYIQHHHFRLGIKKGSILADPVLNHFVSDPHNAKFLVPTQDDLENLTLLLDHQIDGFIADRIAGSILIWQARADRRVVEHYLPMEAPIHLIFSKKTVSPETVRNFDQAIDRVSHEAAYRNDFSWYIYPVIMMQATGQEWFKILDILGTVAFSISGVLIAFTLRKSFVAALIYAILPCLLGGILRDVIIGRTPVEALETPQYLLLICAIVFVGHFTLFGFNAFMRYEQFKGRLRTVAKWGPRIHRFLEHALIVFDALGLASLAVSGVMISLMARVTPLWLWGPFFSFLTASLGTIIRDILSKNENIEDVVGELYSEVGIAWGFFLSVALLLNVNNIQPQLVQTLIVVTVVGGFVTRLLVHYLKVPNVYFR